MKKKILSCSLILTILLSVFLPVLSANASSGREVIRIAYTDDGPLLSYAHNNYHGYIVDYLNEISRYTRWDYEFVPCSWSEALDMLKSGSVDFVPNAQKTPEREAEFLFSSHYLIKDESIIYTRDSRDLCYEEFDAFDGLTYGFLKDTIQPEFFADYASQHGFTYQAKFYNTSTQMLEAFENQEIDAFVDDAFTLYPDFKIIGIFSASPCYFMSGKGNSETMAQLDAAMDAILADNPVYPYDIYKQHFSGLTTSSQPLFTREEKNYIESAGQISIGCYTRFIPYAFQDENGDYQGVIPYLISEIAKQSGLDLVPTPIDSTLPPTEQFSDQIHLVAGVGLSQDIMRNDQLQFTDQFGTETTYVITRKGSFYNNLENLHIALPSAYHYASQYIKSHYPSSTLIYYDSPEACLDATVSGKTDIALLNSYVADYWLTRPCYETLQADYRMSIHESTVILADEQTDEILITILNKTLAQISQQELQQSIDEILFENQYQYTMGDFVTANKAELFLTGLVLLVILISVNFITRRRTKYKTAQREKELFRIKAETDSLTGLYNTETFYEQTEQILSLSAPDEYFIVVTDIEHFKIINDIYGYEEGDKLIRFIGTTLKELAEPYNGLCARLNGDWFACLLPTTMDIEKDFADPLSDRLTHYPIDTRITACMGVYHIHDLALPVFMMCDRARLACVSIQGRFDTHVAVFDDTQRARLLQEHEIVNEMTDALSAGQFQLYIQPKNNLCTGNAIGGEALVRWVHPEKGVLSPGLFIPIFEKNGFITKLDLYILEQTCRTLDHWRSIGKEMIPISVNISRIDFYTPSLVDTICALCQKYDIPYRYIQLEITESAYYEDMKFVVQQLFVLQELGFSILMDDFGSEYSSLSMLKDAPVDILKLDIRFLRNTGDASRGNKIIRSIVELAKELDIDLIVEGVEDADQVEFLRSIHCEAVQGFYFSKPLPLSEFESYMEAHS